MMTDELIIAELPENKFGCFIRETKTVVIDVKKTHKTVKRFMDESDDNFEYVLISSIIDNINHEYLHKVLEEIGEYDASIKYDEQPLGFKELFEDNADLKKVIEADLLKVMGVERV